MKATRDWFGDALVDVAADHEKVLVVNCDLASATKTTQFKKTFPDRFFEIGIAEANAIGVAAGLAQEGYRPFVASFGHFLTGKFLEIFQSVGLNNAGVVLVGTHAGLAIGKDGPTQMGLRDLALIRSLPNVEVLQPADGVETRAMLAYAVTHDRPIYLRLCRQPQREVHDQDYQFRSGHPDVLSHGTDVAVVTMGGMVPVVLDAVELLAPTGPRPTVVNASSLPLDVPATTDLLEKHRHVLVFEDHFNRGGLIDEVGRIVLGLDRHVRFHAWGVDDYGQAGSPEELYERYELDATGVASRIRAATTNSPEIGDSQR
ncbi:transketolase C-terminal domain-containing protein [Micromonospora sp. WMMD961]|uniref:transketolase family protein n=1 Tax=Micromonospora sp. WMMD961 TaxID=3016100 RepID=UPI002416650C|nr:transketolase C-terminal domain-containing protein [Micromonospora sp. WMMD961]MDG4780390.1 transketolase C-terminal domain-containing protein [Micromonospora sp. WMMD961]